MTPPEITQHDRHNLSALHGSLSVPVNHRDASNPPVWARKPTVIATPSDNRRFLPAKQPAPESRRTHDNPYVYNNNLSSGKPRPGNPNSRQTLLSKYPSNSSSPPESRQSKRQRLDRSVFPEPAHGINGASSSRARGIGPADAPKLGIQAFNPPNPVSNDGEIIILDDPEDVGEPVARATKSSSPDPLLLSQPPPQPPPLPRKPPHAFDTLPNTRLPTRSTGKDRAISHEVVPDSEAEDEIEEFAPPIRPLDAKTPGEIPKNIVNDRKSAYEKRPQPAAVRRPFHPPVQSIHLLDPPSHASTVSRMKRKDQHHPRAQGGTSPNDPIGTSSSKFKNSARENEGTFSFPLEAWCFGHHHIQHTEDDPLTLVYERKSTKVRIVSGKQQRGVVFKIDRDVNSVKIVNDEDEPLKNNVLIQFTTVGGKEWTRYEGKLSGFQAGASRHKGHLTFLFSTAKERAFNPSKYQEFVTLIRKEVLPVEIMRPTAGGACWEEALRFADMSDAQNSGKRDEATEDDRTSRTRGTTPSSTSVKSQVSRPDSKPLNGDIVPPTRLRRSARQSGSHTVESTPPPLPQPPSELDEVVLMYPPTGTGALSIMRSDLKRLGPEEYLNDTLIEFGLKLWLNDLRERDPALADQIHVFSSFFYKKLNNRKNPEEGYRSVRKWTSKVDLFSKKYVIVPINENIHWYLAIIYEPGHTLEPPLPPSQPHSARVTRKRKQEQEHSEADIEMLPGVSPEEPDASGAETATEPSSINATCSSIPHIIEDTEMGDPTIPTFERSCSISASKPLSAGSSKSQARDSSPLPDLYLPASDAMEIDVDGPVTKVHQKQAKAEIPSSISNLQSAIPVNHFYASASREVIDSAESPVVTEETEDQQQEAEVDDMLAVPQPSSPNSPPQTYIFTLDSLGTRHPQAIKVLKNYLASEAKDKHNSDQVRDPLGKQVQVPVQPNTWDCGIYLIHFVKVFMNSPAEFLDQILHTRGTIPSSERKKRWQDHEIPLFRDNLLARISKLSDEWKAVREEEAKNKEPEDLSSEGEVDIVDVVGEAPNRRVAGRKQRAPRPSGAGDVDIEEVPSGKAAPAAREKQPVRRIRG